MHLQAGCEGKCSIMWLVLAIVLLLVFGGLGFVAHILWLGLIVAVIFGIAHLFTGRSTV